MEKEEQTLINHPGNALMDSAPFVNSVGHFWGILETRGYMRARFSLANTMELIQSVESAEAQLEHYMDMLQLCRSDNMGVRDLVPGLMIRLNKDQECYNFIRWWVITNDYKWNDKYWNHKNADAFESVDEFKNLDTLCHYVCLILLKIKLLLDLMKLQQSASCLGPKVPREVVDLIQTSAPQSPILRTDSQLMHEEEQERSARLSKLKAQIDTLFAKINKSNRDYWPAVADPDRHLLSSPAAFSFGSVEEMQMCLQHTYHAITETPGALDFIKAKRERRICFIMIDADVGGWIRDGKVLNQLQCLVSISNTPCIRWIDQLMFDDCC